MNLKDKIAVMQAFERGEKVEARYKLFDENPWLAIENPEWSWSCYDYRIAPKSRYLPVYTGPNTTGWYYSKKPLMTYLVHPTCIGYLEDKQDGSPYIFHQL